MSSSTYKLSGYARWKGRDKGSERAWLIQRDAQREGLRGNPEQREALTRGEGEGPPSQAGGEKRRITPCVGIRELEIAHNRNMSSANYQLRVRSVRLKE